ncbi:membrane glycoprotein US2 [Panine betaherpesvirus 2]|uniref:Membrane glycoprotein US2 n=1 Tax=Panine betaherpesvirus 2 TaxID=188763 RepID=Q8QRV5_9BETA|nr:membrane glycoprotein US2 [Panine betaherpesvirus 2]AAM00783.1 membrane glycoprotein US2 [Panine betaherpesvirus 2]QXV67897.1 membrane glycoprotein US2 [Panine betaherpesvirus 2]
MNGMWMSLVKLWASMGPLIRLPALDGPPDPHTEITSYKPWKSTATRPWFTIDENRCHIENGQMFGRGSVSGNLTTFVFDPKADYGGVGENLAVRAEDVEFIAGENLIWRVQYANVLPLIQRLVVRLVLNGDVVWLTCVPEIRVDYTSNAYMWNMQYGMVHRSYRHVALAVLFYALSVTALVIFIVYVTVNLEMSLKWMRFFMC